MFLFNHSSLMIPYNRWNKIELFLSSANLVSSSVKHLYIVPVVIAQLTPQTWLIVSENRILRISAYYIPTNLRRWDYLSTCLLRLTHSACVYIWYFYQKFKYLFPWRKYRGNRHNLKLQRERIYNFFFTQVIFVIRHMFFLNAFWSNLTGSYWKPVLCK